MHNNHTNEHLDFLKKKIKEIKIGLFRSETNSEIQLPNNIIQVLRVEGDGTVWFFTSCSNKQAENIDRSFYACLDFHKRGTDFRLQIRGNASISENYDRNLFMMSNYSEGTLERVLLVKMKIMQAEYFESTPLTDVSWPEKIKSIFSQMFLSHEPRIYNFS